MDVESLAKELILKSMTPEQQMAVLDAVRSSVAQAKEVQKRKIGENVDLVVQALKKIESDIRSRFDDVGNSIEKRVASIKDGRDGINGKDGRDGKDGKNGRDGLKGDKGDAGRDGRDGVDGVDGVSVTNARIDFDGSLVIYLSNGVELNVGEVVAPDLAEHIKVITNGGGTAQFVLDTLASLQTQIDTLIPSQTGNSGKFLTTNGTSTSWASVSGSGLSYQGTWNASTNTPTLASSTGTSGYYYVVSVAGSTNLNGVTDWQPGDWAIFNGTAWQKIDQSWAIAGANDNITSMTGITGGISSPDFIQFDTGASVTNAVGKLYWDDTQKTLSVGLTADIAADVGQTLYAYVTNAEATTITKGQPVYMYSAQGDRVSVKLAYNTGDATSAKTLGVCAEDIASGQAGMVLCQGVQDGLNLGAYTAGDTLYLGATAGTLTATKPYAPNHLVYIGVVERANSGNGRLYVRVQNGYELDELHNVSAQNPTNGQTLIYNESTSLWEKHTLTDGTGISITEGAGSITIANSGVTSAVAGTGISVSGATGAVTITNSAPDQTVSLSSGTGISTSGTYPSFTITNSGVTSLTGTTNEIDVSASTGGVTLSLPSAINVDLNGSVGATTPNAGTFTSLSDSGNLTFTGTGNRITGDFSNATAANRVMFQSSTANSATIVGVIPNGTSTNAQLWCFGSSDPANTSVLQLAGGANANTEVRIASNITGTGTYLPMTFYTGGSERIRVDTSGNVGIGTSSPASRLDVNDGASTTTYPLQVRNSGVGGTDFVGIVFSTGTATDNSQIRAAIGKVQSGGSGILTFSTAASGTTDLSSLTEKMRIDSSGNVGIGTASPASSLSVVKQTAALSGTGNSYGVYLYPTSSGQCWLDAITSSSGNTSMGLRSYNNGTYYTANLDNSGNFQFNSGYGSAVTAYGCRAWVNFDGTGTYSPNPSTSKIRASGNVTSITKNGTGDYTVNLTNAMPDINYSVSGSAGQGGGNFNLGVSRNTVRTASLVRVTTYSTANTITDCTEVNVNITR